MSVRTILVLAAVVLAGFFRPAMRKILQPTETAMKFN